MLCPAASGKFGPTRDSCIATIGSLVDQLIGACE
jgi:hypothetical protein